MNSLRLWSPQCPLAWRAAPAVARTAAAGVLALLLASGFGARRAEAQSYTVTDLGTLGGTYSAAGAINNHGQVVGSAAVPGDDFEHAFLYDGTGMHDLGTFGGLISYGNGIDDEGQIVGAATTAGGMIFHAFLYDGTGMHDLGTLGGGNSYAGAINAVGQIVGHGPLAANRDDHALLFDSSGIHDLGTLPGDVDSVAYGINASGQVVGSSRSTDYNHAFFYDGTRMRDLGTLGGTTATARAINDAGQVVGDSEISTRTASHAFLYDSAGMHDLGTLDGQNRSASIAFGINRAGQVVGASENPTAPDGLHAFLYTAGVMLDLNSLIPVGSGWQLSRAFGINDHGQIVGEGFIGGHRRAFLATPPTAPSISLDAVTLSFGNQGVGTTSSAQLVTVSNRGTMPLTIQQITVTGSDAADFSAGADLNGVTLGPGESRTVSVRFTPAAADGRGARLTISDNAIGSPHGLDLTGSGVGPVLQLSPTTIGFGILPLGRTSSGTTITVSNGGNTPLVIHSIGLSGANAGEFVLHTDLAGATLAPGQSGSISVQFTPTAAGSRSATLTIDDSGPGSPEILTLTGSGVPPAGPVMAYTITDLGTLGGTNSDGRAINSLGQVAGTSDIAGGGYHAFLWDSTGIHDLGTLGFPASNATAINDLGQIVGSSNITGNMAIHPFLWDSAGHPQAGTRDLGTLGGDQANAAGINSAGQVVGTSTTTDFGGLSRYHAFLLSHGAMQDLGVPADLGFPADGNNAGGALAINAAGQVLVSFSRSSTHQSRAYLWQNGGWQHQSALDDMSLFSLNDAGQIAGSTSLGYPDQPPGHAFVYDNAGLHDLGTLGGPASTAIALNSLGQIVGYSQVDGPSPTHPALFSNGVPDHPFLYSGGVMYDLSDLLLTTAAWERFVPYGINDRGQIVGTGIWDAGAQENHAFLLTPTPAPLLRVSAGSLTFGSQPAGTTSGAQTVTLTNTGQLPLTVSTVGLAGANAAHFAIASDSGDATLAPGASRTITITFTPADAGSNSASLEISHNDLRPASPRAVALSGTGIVPAVSLSAGSIRFGNQLVGTTSSEQTVSLSNTGPAPLVIQKVDVEGDNAGEFAATDLSGITLALGESRAIGVRFTPAARGSRSATLVLTSNAPDSPARLSLTGAGIAPVVSISPSSLNFGAQAVGMTNDAQAITLQNTGDAPLDLQNVTLTGANPGDFTISADGWSGAHLLPGQIATLNLRFTPAAVGDRSASLMIPEGAGSAHAVPLSGTGTAPAASLSAGSLSFDDQVVGTISAEQTLTLTNTGSAPLTLGAVSLSGANAGDFVAALDPGGVTLAPGESRTLRVRFRPTVAGSRSATLAISDSAAGSPHTVALSGTGTAPSVTFGISRLAGPGSLSFGSVALGASSATQSLTLTNSGNAPLTIGGISLAGAAAADYQITADSGGSTLPPGGTRTLALRFTPLGLGNSPASLTITDNAAGGQQSVSLSGSGILPGPGSQGRALIPTGGELFIAAIDGTAGHSAKAVLSVGQSVTVKLLLKFANGAVADVSADPHCLFGTGAAVGKFTAKNIWTARAQDAGKTVVISGSYRSPVGRQRIAGTVTVTVRAVRRGRR